MGIGIKTIFDLAKMPEKEEQKISNTAEPIEQLFQIVTELDARDSSNNCVIPELLAKNWNELCDEAIEILRGLKMVKPETKHIIEENHIYCANLEANNKLIKGHRLIDSEGKCIGFVSLDKIIEWNVKEGTIRRCEHNCHLCKKEWLGRCFGKYYGKDVSVDDMPICDEYIYGGSKEHQKEIDL